MLKKHGTVYFETLAITGISHAEYERIAPHIRTDGIHCGDEVIALIPENTQRAIEAVGRLQAEAPPAPCPKPASSAEQKLADLEHRVEQLCADFEKAVPSCHGDNLQQLYNALYRTQEKFQRLWLDVRGS
jgi:hypothetical protein